MAENKSKTSRKDKPIGSEIKTLGILETQEIERKRIARELHDTTVQNLTNMIHKTELCTKLIDIDPIHAKLELFSMIATLRSTIDDMRDIIYNLRPMSLDDLGLSITIERFLAQSKAYKEVEVSLSILGDEVSIKSIIKLTLFRIVQEACNNAWKHAKAKNILIKLTYLEKEVLLDIIDNGIGFDDEIDLNEVAGEITSFGLSIMKERVYLLSGEIKISTKKDEGTGIYVRVPLYPSMEETV